MIDWERMEGVQPEGQYCVIEQYRMLMRCSQKKDVTEWNVWRAANRRTRVVLQGANLEGAYLKNADLSFLHLEGADLYWAHMEGADLGEAYLKDACLEVAHLESAHLEDAHLVGAHLVGAHLEGAGLGDTDLEGANLVEAHLEGTDLQEAHLEGANCRFALVNGETLIDTGFIDRKTDFTGVGLESARILPGIRQLLEYNIRRKQWETWYKKHPVQKWGVKPFWWVSDYGRSTFRILALFFSLAVAFAFFYVLSGLWNPSDCFVEDLFAKNQEGVAIPGLDHFSFRLMVRGIYFSVVTMTTLGFGDMHANPSSMPGHILLTLQVLTGYVLLGALITRLSILFTAGGPSADFVNEPAMWGDLKRLWAWTRERLVRIGLLRERK
jgi:hypothetical protein